MNLATAHKAIRSCLKAALAILDGIGGGDPFPDTASAGGRLIPVSASEMLQRMSGLRTGESGAPRADTLPVDEQIIPKGEHLVWKAVRKAKRIVATRVNDGSGPAGRFYREKKRKSRSDKGRPRAKAKRPAKRK